MAKAFINDENLTDIADAIRATLDESRQYLPSEMAAAIQSIPIMAQLNRKKYFQSVPAGAASGYATIEKVEGNTVAWNQMIKFLNQSYTGLTITTINDNEISYNYQLTSGVYFNMKNSPIYINRKYYIYLKSSSAAFRTAAPSVVTHTASQIYNGINEIVTASQDRVRPFTFYTTTNDGTEVSGTCKCIVFDLTAIFGAGNEPTTVADFEAWMAQNGLPSVADYNAGELLSVKMSGMQTQDSSQQTLDTLPFDVTTITGINTATNVREVIFPNGMKQADQEGTVKDELDLVNGTATVKVGYVKFTGNEGWASGSVTNVYRLSLPSKTVGKTEVFSTPYTYDSNPQTSLPDKCLGMGASSNSVFIRDDNYTTLAQFTSYLAIQYSNGTPVTLVYPLATPITYTDLQDANGNPLNPRYKVEQGGTEQVLPINTSTPTTVAPTLTTTYTKDNN